MKIVIEEIVDRDGKTRLRATRQDKEKTNEMVEFIFLGFMESGKVLVSSSSPATLSAMGLIITREAMDKLQ